MRPDTEVVVHGTHAGTHDHRPGAGPSTDVGYAYMQALHFHQFAYAAILAEEGGYDAFALSTIPEPGIRDWRSRRFADVAVAGDDAKSAVFFAASESADLSQLMKRLLDIKYAQRA